MIFEPKRTPGHKPFQEIQLYTTSLKLSATNSLKLVVI